MSNQSEKGVRSKNSKEKHEVIPREKVQMTDYQHFNLHSKLIDALTLTVTEKVDQVRDAVQLQGSSAEEANMAVVAVASTSYSLTGSAAAPPAPRKRHPMTTSVEVGSMEVNFDCPQYLLANNIDMDLVTSSYHNSLQRDGERNMRAVEPKFSFSGRLDNWKIECRQRPCGRLDMFFRFPRGRKLFRSIREVVEFMLYETYPDNFKLDLPQDQDNQEAPGQRPKRKRRNSIYKGAGRRTKHRRTNAKNQGDIIAAHEEETATEEVEEDTSHSHYEQERKASPEEEKEGQKQASTDKDTDLLNISTDLSAYESLFDHYFD